MLFSLVSLCLFVISHAFPSEIVTQCTSDFCVNGGVCLIVQGLPSCACFKGYSGIHCETASAGTVDPCSARPCLNNATCTPAAGGRFTCHCGPTHYGTLCQEAIAPNTPAGIASPAPTAPAVCPSTIHPPTTIHNLGCHASEIVFLVEAARGDSEMDVDHQAVFIKKLVDQWHVTSFHVRVGVVVYHDTVHEVVHLGDHANDPAALKERLTTLSRMVTPSGQNDLAGALDYVKTTSFVGARQGAWRVTIPIVHMMPAGTEGAVVAAAERLKADCVTLIGLAVYNSRSATAVQDQTVQRDILGQAVSQPVHDHMVQYRDFTSLDNAARSFDDTTYKCSH